LTDIRESSEENRTSGNTTEKRGLAKTELCQTLYHPPRQPVRRVRGGFSYLISPRTIKVRQETQIIFECHSTYQSYFFNAEEGVSNRDGIDDSRNDDV
jgi:hypothetical protein